MSSALPRGACPAAARGECCARVNRTLLVALAAFTLAACGPKPTNDPLGRGVLVIAIDGLRADHLSAAGYDRPTTPVLDALAKQGTLFTNAWSAAPRALPAHAALLTGCDPRIARRDDPAAPDGGDPFAWRIPAGAPKLAQELLAHGYATGAFVGDPALSPVSGFDAGFQVYDAPRDGADDLAEYEFDDVSSRFVNWLFEKSPSQDWFAYLHVDELVRLWGRKSANPRWDTYFPPRPALASIPPVADADPVFFAVPRARWQGGTLSVGAYEARYDGALCALDSKLGQLLERLRRTGRLKNTTVVVTGTFGTSFGESGLYLASGTLSDVDLRVPFFVRPPLASSLPRGRTSAALVSLIDVAPTILDLELRSVPRGMHGRSQLSELSAKASDPRDAVFASGGLFPGWVAIGERACLEHSARGGPGLLGESWSGARGVAAEEAEFLHVHGASLGHLGAGADDPAERARLAQLGADWFAGLERARRHYQGLDVLDARALADLYEKNLIGERR